MRVEEIMGGMSEGMGGEILKGESIGGMTGGMAGGTEMITVMTGEIEVEAGDK